MRSDARRHSIFANTGLRVKLIRSQHSSESAAGRGAPTHQNEPVNSRADNQVAAAGFGPAASWVWTRRPTAVQSRVAVWPPLCGQKPNNSSVEKGKSAWRPRRDLNPCYRRAGRNGDRTRSRARASPSATKFNAHKGFPHIGRHRVPRDGTAKTHPFGAKDGTREAPVQAINLTVADR
jgi:hypothetical protein